MLLPGKITTVTTTAIAAKFTYQVTVTVIHVDDDDSSLDMIYLASKPYFRVGKMIALQTMKIKVEITFKHTQ